MARTKRPKQTELDIESYLQFLTDIEGDLSKVSGAGRVKEEREILANELVSIAQDAESPLVAILYALRAVRLAPTCLDARVRLADAVGGPEDELIEELQQIVAVGEADLGKPFFAENRGHFWGVMETRPYMRARTNLALKLYQAGRFVESASHYEQMLKLNPNDNLGLRYTLIGCYLELNRLEDARKLLKRYDELSSFWLWSRVLERYLSNELDEAARLLGTARAQNPHVEALLTGRKKAPKDMPPYYQLGDITEAVTCFDVIGPVWDKRPEAIAWLARQSPTKPTAKPKAKARKTASPIIH